MALTITNTREVDVLAVWDLTRVPATSFVGVGLGAVTVLLAARSLGGNRAGV